MESKLMGVFKLILTSHTWAKNMPHVALLVLCLLITCQAMSASPVTPNRTASQPNIAELEKQHELRRQKDAAILQRVSAIFAQPDEKIELARAELVVAKIIDPSIDEAATLRKIDAMVLAVRRLLPTKASSLDKVQTLRRFLYQKGAWNNNRSFQYDFSDPLGTSVRNKLLANYIVSRKGNCVSMPFLFIVLGQRIGIDVTAAAAPNHVFVKYRNEAGQWFNLEATGSAGPTSLQSYREQAPMTDEAIASGIYMRPLSKKETVVLMINSLMQYYVKLQRHDQVIAIADLSLKHDPRSIQTLLYRGSAYGRMYEAGMQEFQESQGLMHFPAEEKMLLQHFARSNQADFARAEALGWREPTPEENEQYLKKIKQRIEITRKN